MTPEELRRELDFRPVTAADVEWLETWLRDRGFTPDIEQVPAAASPVKSALLHLDRHFHRVPSDRFRHRCNADNWAWLRSISPETYVFFLLFDLTTCNIQRGCR